VYRIINPGVKNAVENSVEALGYQVQVFERELAFVQLAIDKYIIDNALHHALYA
jgi:hypothetical protein